MSDSPLGRPTYRAIARLRVPFWKRTPVHVGLVLAAATIALAPFTVYAALFGPAAVVLLLGYIFVDGGILSDLVEVAVHEDHVVIDGRVYPRGVLRAALFVPGPEHDFVRLVFAMRPSVNVRFNRKDEADAFTHALGLDPTARAASFLLPSPLRQSLVQLALVPALMAVGMVARSGEITFALLVLALVLFVLPRRVRVGADGIAMRWLFLRRFVRIADVRQAEAQERRVGFGTNRRTESFVRLTLRDERVDLLTADIEDARIVATRIEHVLGAATTRAPTLPDVTRALARASGELAHDWLIRLRAAAAGEDATYRAAPIERDALVRVASDASRRREERLAAATALVATRDEQSRKAVAELANAVAEPAVRDGLLRIAEAEDDAALVEALEDSAPRASRSGG